MDGGGLAAKSHSAICPCAGVTRLLWRGGAPLCARHGRAVGFLEDLERNGARLDLGRDPLKPAISRFGLSQGSLATKFIEFYESVASWAHAGEAAQVRPLQIGAGIVTMMNCAGFGSAKLAATAIALHDARPDRGPQMTGQVGSVGLEPGLAQHHVPIGIGAGRFLDAPPALRFFCHASLF